jgi:Fe2+ or Zn2+ uptake regulation protein
MDNLSHWEEKLKENGIRCTKQRTAILEVLWEEKRPLSASDIFIRLKRNNPKLRLSTVYRNLNSFAEKKLVRKMELELDKKEKYFEILDGEHHHHLICTSCGEIIPLNCPLKSFEREITRKTRYQITDHHIKLYGLCPECQ